MCQKCADASREVFPEVPNSEMGHFLFGTTCFPFGDPEVMRRQLIANRCRMTTDDYRECYALADEDLDSA